MTTTHTPAIGQIWRRPGDRMPYVTFRALPTGEIVGQPLRSMGSGESLADMVETVDSSQDWVPVLCEYGADVAGYVNDSGELLCRTTVVDQYGTLRQATGAGVRVISRRSVRERVCSLG